jgi:hypothetical protein
MTCCGGGTDPFRWYRQRRGNVGSRRIDSWSYLSRIGVAAAVVDVDDDIVVEVVVDDGGCGGGDVGGAGWKWWW